MRRFTMVASLLWRSRHFTGLASDSAKLLYFYYLTSERQNPIGAYLIPDGYACNDLGWDLALYQRERGALVEADLIVFDLETSTVFVRRWFNHSPPKGQKSYQAGLRLIDELDSPIIAEVVTQEFQEALERLEKAQPMPGLPGAGGKVIDLAENGPFGVRKRRQQY